MRHVVLLALLILSSSAYATEVRLTLYEARTKQTTFHALDLSTGVLKPAAAAGTVELPSISEYRVRNEHVETASGGALDAEADEILCQATADDLDVLVVRHEYNSFSNPLYWLAAISGHPIQVSKIVLLLVRDRKVERSIELRREPSSYHWEATLFEALPNKP